MNIKMGTVNLIGAVFWLIVALYFMGHGNIGLALFFHFTFIVGLVMSWKFRGLTLDEFGQRLFGRKSN